VSLRAGASNSPVLPLFVLIHPSAWNKDSATFAFWAFSELPLETVRKFLKAPETKPLRAPTPYCLAPIYRPNPCSERRSNPFSVSFRIVFSEIQLKGAERFSVRRVMSSSCSQPSPTKE
jgi:hypothetical protein